MRHWGGKPIDYLGEYPKFWDEKTKYLGKKLGCSGKASHPGG
jgi:hypothetical protein